ncbi:MAG: ABC transporter ATP-binding protein [Desulfobacterales bacterium]|nr:ABC transporter ATP-binding protein [Desulfobacterales bacterium]MBS3756400.1 ABC transporter ATP-binding protein [Desulfobacterales bacterium]
MKINSKDRAKAQWDAADVPLLEVSDLKTWFEVKRGIFSRKAEQIRAVDGVTFSLMANETIGLVGESGCGKTTLGRTLLGLEAASGGSVFFRGEPLLTLSHRRMKAMRRRLQVVFQDPLSSLNPRMNVMDIVTEGLLQFRMLTDSREVHAKRLLREVGLDEEMIYRFPHEFSGGQRQRINVARAISLRPDLIICDEAVSALDVSIQAQVINLLLSLQQRHHLSYLFISHDLSVVSNIADRIAVMYLGRIVEIGKTIDIIEKPLHPYTRMLIAAIPVAGQKRVDQEMVTGETPSPAAPPNGCHFHPRCPEAMPVCRHAEPPEAWKNGHYVCCHMYRPNSG